MTDKKKKDLQKKWRHGIEGDFETRNMHTYIQPVGSLNLSYASGKEFLKYTKLKYKKWKKNIKITLVDYFETHHNFRNHHKK